MHNDLVHSSRSVQNRSTDVSDNTIHGRTIANLPERVSLGPVSSYDPSTEFLKVAILVDRYLEHEFLLFIMTGVIDGAVNGFINEWSF